MEYTVACNWDPELIEKINHPEVTSLFGALPNSVISGGRPSNSIKNLNDEVLKNYIRRVHEKGMEFSFNVNSTCTSNKESTAKGFNEFMDYMERIVSLGVDAVTLGNTNIINIVKKNFPQLKVKVSTFLKVSNVQQAQRYEDLGVDAIMLSEHINRDFELLSKIRKNVKCKLILIANVGCIFNCPNVHSHANSLAHSGTVGGVKNTFTESYNAYCFQKRLEDPSEVVKIRWIRPEDVAYYENVGIDMLKILERYSPTDVIVERVKAYTDRKYDGNILNLLGQVVNYNHKGTSIGTTNLNGNDANVKKALKYYSAFSMSLPELLYLDNNKLPSDFIESFSKRDCGELSCNTCGYCKRVAAQAVNTPDEKMVNLILNKLKNVRSGVFDGSLLY